MMLNWNFQRGGEGGIQTDNPFMAVGRGENDTFYWLNVIYSGKV